MYTMENYVWGLVAYGLGCLLMLPLTWRLTRLLIPWSPPRVIVRLFAAAFLLTPVKAYEDMDFLAPAWVVAGFELVRPTTVEGPFRAIMPMLAVFLAGVLLYVGFVLARFWVRRGQRQEA
ncbi:MAG: hypothetical protein M0R02_15750 [Bacteroidales bacterium]|nr:hypothetical protein [Bacteroidales bacterium]